MPKLLFSLTCLIISSSLAWLYQNKQTLSIDSDCSLKICGRKLKTPELLHKNNWIPTGCKCNLGNEKRDKKSGCIIAKDMLCFLGLEGSVKYDFVNNSF